MKHSITAKNALWLIFGKSARIGIDLTVGLLTARYLGPSNYGLLQYAAAYTGFFSALCTLGIPSVLGKELVDAPGKENEILGTALFLRGVSSILSAFVILWIVKRIEEDTVAVAAVCFSCLGMIFQSFELFHYYFQFRLRSDVTALVYLAAHILAVGYKAVLLWQGKTALWFAFAAAVEQICTALFLLAAYRRQGGARLRISREKGRRILKKSCHFILPGLMAAVYTQTDRIMLRQLIGEAEIGYYSTAASLCSSWCFVLSAIIDAMYPEIAMAGKQQEALFIRRNKQLYAVVFYLSVAVSFLFCIFARPMVAALYGEDYLPAAAPLRILTWSTAFSYLGVARNAWIVCKNRQKDLIWVSAAAACTNVALNYLLIPLWGAAGAAAASVIAQVITSVGAPIFLRGMRENAGMILDAVLFKGLFGNTEDRV